MIDKVDKPDAPTYKVQATVETQDRRSQKDQQERREEDEYSASAGDKNWRKFHTDAKDRKSVKLRRKDIAKLFFKQVILQKGLVVIEVDLQLINGQILKNCHLFSTKIETYWKLKKLNVDQMIPADELITEDYVEVSVLYKAGTAQRSKIKRAVGKDIKTAKTEEKTGWSLWPLVDKFTGKPNWVAITIYTIIITGIFVALIMLI